MQKLPSKPRPPSIIPSIFLLIIIGAVMFADSQQVQNRSPQNATPPARQDRSSNGAEVHLLPVQGNVSLLVGAGGNITVQAGEDGILLVDTGLANTSDRVIETIRPLSKRPLAYIINTDERDDHTGGNESIAKIGRPVSRGTAGTYIISFVTVLDRMSAPTGQTAATPEGAWPTDTYSGLQKNLHFNGEAVQIFHQPGTTDGNSIVLFRGSDVVSTGDIFDPTEYPIIDLKSGGSIQGVLEGLNRLKRMVVPVNHMEGGTMVIPGHGWLCDAADVAIYQQMVTIVRDRIQDMIKNGMTLEQVKAAKPTQDYDPIYGRATANWTTDMFIEAVYKSLSAKVAPHGSPGAN